MFPVLGEIFGYPVASYGVFLALAHLAGLALVLLVARARRLPAEPYVDLIFVVLISGLVGARLGYALEHRGEFPSLLDVFRLSKGGLSFFAGLLAAFPAYLLFLRRKRLPVWETSDLLTPALPLSLALVRLGCFGAGCCHGVATSLPWGMRFDSPFVSESWAGRILHPTQLYESLFLFVLGGFLLWWSGKRPRPGLVACAFLVAYALYRLATNPLRGDLEPGPAGLPLAQWAAGVLLLLAGVTFWWRSRRVTP